MNKRQKKKLAKRFGYKKYGNPKAVQACIRYCFGEYMKELAELMPQILYSRNPIWETVSKWDQPACFHSPPILNIEKGISFNE